MVLQVTAEDSWLSFHESAQTAHNKVGLLQYHAPMSRCIHFVTAALSPLDGYYYARCLSGSEVYLTGNHVA